GSSPRGEGKASARQGRCALSQLALLLRARDIITLQPAAGPSAAVVGNRRWLMRIARTSGGVIAAVAAVLLTAGPALAGPAAASSHAQAGFRAVPAAAAALPAPVPGSPSPGARWQPPLGATRPYPLHGSGNSSGQCLYPGTGFINTAITGTSFATGQQVAPTVFDIDIYQDGKCYTPNNYGVLNTAAVNALHAQGDKVIGYIDAGTAETWRPDYPQYQRFNSSGGRWPVGRPVGGFRDEFWLNINTNVSGTNPNTGQTETAQQFILDELTARLAKAKSAGADAIEFDNIDGYQNKTGLTISAATQEQFDAAI